MPRADLPRRGLAIATTPPVTAVNTAVRNWNEVKGHFSRDGAYRYIEFAEARYVIRPRSTVLPALHRLIAGGTGAVWGGSGWIKSASDHDVERLRQLWIENGAGDR